jgi:hypothetical protein
MSLLKGINQLWFQWQEAMDELSITFCSEDVRRLLLNAFKYNVIIPNESGHMRTRGQKRFAPPVHAINIGLRAELEYGATRTKPFKLSTQNSDAITSCLAMLTTLGLDQDMNDIFVGLHTHDTLAPVVTQAEADRMIDSLSKSFKRIMNRDFLASITSVIKHIATLTITGNRLEEVLKCLSDAANEYLLEKASNISGLASMSLLKGINQLWLQWQEGMSELSMTFLCVSKHEASSQDNVRRLLLNAFKDNVIIPNESGHMTRGRKRFAPPVNAINIGLRATLEYEATRPKPFKLSTQNSDALKSCLSMITTLGLDQDMKDIFVSLHTHI